MKYKYFKFETPTGSDNVFIARVSPNEDHYEYRAMKRENDMFFHWDNDWIKHVPINNHINQRDALSIIIISGMFTPMDDEEVFNELL